MNNSLTLQKLATSIIDQAEELKKLTQNFAILSQRVKSIDSEQETEVSWLNSLRKKLDKVGQSSIQQTDCKTYRLTQQDCPTLSRLNESQEDFTEESLLEAISAFESKLLEYQNHSVE